jgi:hypothetical protein
LGCCGKEWRDGLNSEIIMWALTQISQITQITQITQQIIVCKFGRSVHQRGTICAPAKKASCSILTSVLILYPPLPAITMALIFNLEPPNPFNIITLLGSYNLLYCIGW